MDTCSLQEEGQAGGPQDVGPGMDHVSDPYRGAAAGVGAAAG